jgi:pimeloyl-ACP methyl ester carboxylesterase
MEGVAERMVEYERAQPRVSPDRVPLMLERARYKLTSMDLDSYTAFAGCLTTFDPMLERLAAEIRCPTTVLIGENDAGLRAAAREMTDAIDGAVEVVIPDAAHSPQEENPEAWLAAVRTHLARADREVRESGGPSPRRA